MHRTHCRFPRAGTDRIDGAPSALAAISLALTRPLRPETVVLVLDPERCGRSIVVVDGTERPDDVLGVVECLAVGVGDSAGLVVASVRPPGQGVDVCGDRTDADRWLEMSDLAETVGVEVVEWFVIGRTIRCPRDLLGESPRW